MKKMGQMFDNTGRTALHYCVMKFDEFCQQNQVRGDMFSSLEKFFSFSRQQRRMN